MQLRWAARFRIQPLANDFTRRPLACPEPTVRGQGETKPQQPGLPRKVKTGRTPQKAEFFPIKIPFCYGKFLRAVL